MEAGSLLGDSSARGRESLFRKITELQQSITAIEHCRKPVIAANPPLTVQGIKDVILYNRENGVYPGLRYVAQKNAAALPSEDLMEAVAAFMEKRAAAEAAFAEYLPHCPAAQTVVNCVAIEHRLAMEDL